MTRVRKKVDVKKLFKNFAFLLCVLVISYVLIVLFFRIKEPGFKAPVNLKGSGMPIRNDAYGEGRFGANRNGGRLHAGIDIKAPIGAPVYASKSGIARCRDLKKGYGKLIVINHPGGYQTRYGHLSEFKVNNLRWVKQGAVIGKAGKTGNADYGEITPHLHFEIRKRGKPENPAEYLK